MQRRQTRACWQQWWCRPPRLLRGQHAKPDPLLTEVEHAAVILKTRGLLVRQRDQAINAWRAHLSDLGIVAGRGISRIEELIAIVRDEDDARPPRAATYGFCAWKEDRAAEQEVAPRQLEEIAVKLRQVDGL